MQEALSGLPGVESVKVDLDRELLHVRFDAKQQTAEAMMQAVDQQGFQAKIVAGP